MPVSRFQTTFAALRDRNEKALVAFVTAGDPLPNRTADIVCALADAGADIVEIGIPFSDPLADGPTIQEASFRALQAGMTPPKVLDIVREIRTRNTHTPLVLMGAYNPVMQYGGNEVSVRSGNEVSVRSGNEVSVRSGNEVSVRSGNEVSVRSGNEVSVRGVEAFAHDAANAGADGAILTDLTPEEATEWKRYADAAGIATIFLLAPTSTPGRMALVGKMATGFIYTMSRAGVTGARADVPDDLLSLIEQVRSFGGDTPICVGFGVSKPEQVREICRYADGAVVGSVLVDLLHRERDNPELLTVATDFISELKDGTRSNQ